MAAKCNKGKSCGASCVQKSKFCSVKLGPKQSASLSAMSRKLGVVALFEAAKAHKAPKFRAEFERIRKELRAEIGGQIRKPADVEELKKRMQTAGLLPSSKNSALPQVKTSETKPKRKEDPETPEEEWNRLSAEDFDKKLQSKNLTRFGDNKYNDWIDSSTYKAGEGSFARVYVNSDSKFVKRGIIGEQEATILAKVGAKDMGPGLVAADLNGKVKIDKDGQPNLELEAIAHFGLRHGRLAMTKIPGRDLEEALAETGKIEGPETKINGIPAADIYWKAMADLHRLGVAHNDAHPGNLFVGDRSGKGRWVDFGMAQDSPKAALTEALGAFAHISILYGKDYKKHLAEDSAAATGYLSEGNWQTRAWYVTGMDRVDAIMGKPAAKRLEEDCPVLAQVRRNRARVDKLLEGKYNLSPDEIAAIYAHGIRSPLSSYEQGPWRKLSDQDAQDLISVLYKGV